MLTAVATVVAVLSVFVIVPVFCMFMGERKKRRKFKKTNYKESIIDANTYGIDFDCGILDSPGVLN